MCITAEFGYLFNPGLSSNSSIAKILQGFYRPFYLEQYKCDTLPFVHQHLQHTSLRLTSFTCPWKSTLWPTTPRATVSEVFFWKPDKDFMNLIHHTMINHASLQFCNWSLTSSTLSWECIIFLTIITTVLGLCYAQCKLETWLCTFMPVKQSLCSACEPHNTLNGHYCSIEVYMVIYWTPKQIVF